MREQTRHGALAEIRIARDLSHLHITMGTLQHQGIDARTLCSGRMVAVMVTWDDMVDTRCLSHHFSVDTTKLTRMLEQAAATMLPWSELFSQMPSGAAVCIRTPTLKLRELSISLVSK